MITARRLVGYCLTIVFILFVYSTITHKLTDATELSLYPDTISLLYSLIGMLTWVIIYEIAWEWLLRKVCIPGVKIRWSITGEAFFKSLLARYTPGQVWQVFVRAESLAKHQIPRKETIRSVLYEQLDFMIATIIYTLILSPFFIANSIVNIPPLVLLLIVTCAIIAVSFWLFAPQKLITIINLFFSKITGREELEPLKIRGTALHWQIGFLLFFIVVFLQGLILYPIIHCILPFHIRLTLTQWIVIIGSYPIARMLGQFAVVFPGGLGVREGAYILLLITLVDSNTSSVIAIWARLLQIFSEMIMFVVFSFKNLILSTTNAK